MRIGLITGEYPPMQGGVGAFTQELGRALADAGHTIHILTERQVSSRDEFGMRISGNVNSWNRASLGQIQQWAKHNRLDILNLQYEAAAFRMAQLIHFLPRWLSGIPVVTTFHDLLVPYLFPKAGPLRFQTILALAHASAGVITTNRQDEQRLTAHGIQRLCTIPIGSNIAVNLPPHYDRVAWRQSLDISGDAALLGYFGFMNASKGIDSLLAALHRLLQDGEDAYLLMIGGRTGASDPTNAHYADEIDALIAQYGLADHIRWTGFVAGPQVSANLTACDVLALPYQDGLSLRRGSFMAAIAHGCAIVTTQPQPDVPEVQDRVHALLVPPGNPPALAAGLHELLSSGDLRRTLGKNALHLAANFTWGLIAERTSDFFVEILNA